MTKGTFGEHLKREREMRGVSLDEISAATRIGTRFLEALESERWEQLPGGVFNRGFVRAVSRFLGLNEEDLVAEYALATDERPVVAAWSNVNAGNFPAEQGVRWKPWIAVLVLVALIVGAWWGWHRYSNWKKSRVEQQTSSLPALGSTASVQTRAVNSGGVAPPATTEGTAPQQAPSNPASSELLELKIAAGKRTSVTVVSDGKTVFDGRMDAGQNQGFQARERFEVRAGNSAAVLLELNGQTLPAIGVPGQPGSVTLTHKDLKKASGGPD